MTRKIVKAVAAILIFITLFTIAQQILAGNEDVRDSRRVTGFYEQEAGSLDAVFIGSSATYAFWIAPYAWQEFGIAVHPYAVSSMPLEPMRFIVEECRKTQPDALYIINLTSLYDDRSLKQLFYIFNEMPLNMTKLRAIHYTCESFDLTPAERLELYFPILRFHDRWYEVGMQDIMPRGNAYKSGNTYNGFFNTDETLQDCVPNAGVCAELPDNMINTINDMIDYFESESVRFMFVIVPQTFQNEKKHEYQNAAVQLVAERGYEVLNMHTLVDEMELDFRTDFYNNAHTNHHGAIKVTNYLSRYLMENFGLEDKRGDPAYADWDEAAARYYHEVLAPELNGSDMKYFTSPIPEKPQ